MIITDFMGGGYDNNRLYSVMLDEDEYALFSELEEQREFASIRATKKAAKKIAEAVNSGRATGKHAVDALRLDTDIARQGYKTMNGVTKRPMGGKTFFVSPTFNGNTMRKLQGIQHRAENAINRNVSKPEFSKAAQNQFEQAARVNKSAWNRFQQKRKSFL